MKSEHISRFASFRDSTPADNDAAGVPSIERLADRFFAPCVRSACKSAVDLIGIVAAVNQHGCFIDANAAFWRAYGAPEGSRALPGLREILSRTEQRLIPDVLRAIRNQGHWRGEVVARNCLGEDVWVDVTVTSQRGWNGELSHYQLVALDFTEQKNAEIRAARERARRKEAEELFADILNTIPNGVVACDEDGRVVFVNSAHRRLFESDANNVAVVGRPLPPGLGADRRDRNGSGRQDGPCSVDILHRAGADRWVQVDSKRSTSGRRIAVQTDVTSLKRAERKIREQATRDPLTGSYNRLALFSRLERFISSARDGRGTCAVLLVDLDNFKAIMHAACTQSSTTP